MNDIITIFEQEGTLIMVVAFIVCIGLMLWNPFKWKGTSVGYYFAPIVSLISLCFGASLYLAIGAFIFVCAFVYISKVINKE